MEGEYYWGTGTIRIHPTVRRGGREFVFFSNADPGERRFYRDQAKQGLHILVSAKATDVDGNPIPGFAVYVAKEDFDRLGAASAEYWRGRSLK